MEKVKQWLLKKPATKASWIAAFTGVFTLIVVGTQTVIYYRQQMIMERQTDIATQQSRLIQNQLELSTRPYIEIKPNSNFEAEKLTILNSGTFSVRNLHVQILYFAKIINHGWWVSKPTGGLPFKGILAPRDSWEIDISNYGKMFHDPPMSKDYSIVDDSQSVVFLISFEREFDGKSYLDIEPSRLHDDQLTFDSFFMDQTGLLNKTGPLETTGYFTQAVELTFKYLKNSPPKVYEIYNYNYLISNAPTDSLGDLHFAP
jgi:hypothetical protein